MQRMDSFGETRCQADREDKVIVQTNLSQTVDVAGANAQYDENVKQLLADKQILAWILKYAVREFRDMELDVIADGIDQRIEIGKAQVDPGKSKSKGLEQKESESEDSEREKPVPGKITGDSTEDNTAGEGKIVYDIRFTVQFGGEDTRFLINVEAQKSTDSASLGYHLENRIVYYLSRMVSSQKHTEFLHSEYDRLKRVRSIWICMDGDREGDSIEEISLRKDMVCK